METTFPFQLDQLINITIEWATLAVKTDDIRFVHIHPEAVFSITVKRTVCAIAMIPGFPEPNPEKLRCETDYVPNKCLTFFVYKIMYLLI